MTLFTKLEPCRASQTVKNVLDDACGVTDSVTDFLLFVGMLAPLVTCGTLAAKCRVDCASGLRTLKRLLLSVQTHTRRVGGSGLSGDGSNGASVHVDALASDTAYLLDLAKGLEGDSYPALADQSFLTFSPNAIVGLIVYAVVTLASFVYHDLFKFA